MEPTRVGHGFLTGGVRGALSELRASPPGSTLLVAACAVVLWAVALGRSGADPRLRALSGLIVLWLLIVGGPNRESRHGAPVTPALSGLAAIGLTGGVRRDGRTQAVTGGSLARASRTRPS